MTPPDGFQPDRRGFFRDSISRVIGPVADYLAERLPERDPVMWLRPPGAIAEAVFADTCRRCGACVEVCPADAIKRLHAPNMPADGTPIIDANVKACVVCEGLKCTHTCPSGALLPLAAPVEIRMGLAIVHGDHCVRSRGDRCTTCADVCPLGVDAIRIDSPGEPEVLAGCTGCGICQEACPTRPRAIVVKPVRFLDPDESGG